MITNNNNFKFISTKIILCILFINCPNLIHTQNTQLNNSQNDYTPNHLALGTNTTSFYKLNGLGIDNINEIRLNSRHLRQVFQVNSTSPSNQSSSHSYSINFRAYLINPKTSIRNNSPFNKTYSHNTNPTRFSNIYPSYDIKELPFKNKFNAYTNYKYEGDWGFVLDLLRDCIIDSNH